MFRHELVAQELRNSIGKWIGLFEASHDSEEDGRLKTMFMVLSQTVNKRGLPSEQQSMVDESQAKGAIEFHQNEDAVQAVLGILNVVAANPLTAVIKRLIASFSKFLYLTRSKNEDLSMFFYCSRKAAAEGSQQTSLSPSSQIGQVMPFTLLNNANLDEHVLSSAKLQLMAHCNARHDAALLSAVYMPDSCSWTNILLQKFMVELIIELQVIKV